MDPRWKVPSKMKPRNILWIYFSFRLKFHDKLNSFFFRSRRLFIVELFMLPSSLEFDMFSLFWTANIHLLVIDWIRTEIFTHKLSMTQNFPFKFLIREKKINKTTKKFIFRLLNICYKHLMCKKRKIDKHPGGK